MRAGAARKSDRCMKRRGLLTILALRRADRVPRRGWGLRFPGVSTITSNDEQEDS